MDYFLFTKFFGPLSDVFLVVFFPNPVGIKYIPNSEGHGVMDDELLVTVEEFCDAINNCIRM